jgi:hypothetical protein
MDTGVREPGATLTPEHSPGQPGPAGPAAALDAAVGHLLDLPRGEQPGAAERVRGAHLAAPCEAWNTAFGPGSLYEAWARTTVMQGLYAANSGWLRGLLDARPGWRVLEVGGGDGALWARTLRPDDQGELWLVDPLAEVHAQVAAQLPAGVRLVPLETTIEHPDRLAPGGLPAVDAVVMSLSLHHVAGADAAERAQHGLGGAGKAQVLAAVRSALLPRGGEGVLNEADVFCDLALPPGDPILVDRILDSYVRRTGLSLLHDLAGRTDADADLRGRWRTILRRWCLDQVEVAQAPLAERDVYELDVPRWLAVLDAAGLEVAEHAFTDRYGLFHRYLFRPRPAAGSVVPARWPT